MSKEDSSVRVRGAIGRPRSPTSRAAIIAAAQELLVEVGPNRLTVDAVAKRARVGKPTIYRTWANAQELAMSALAEPTDVSQAPTTIEELVESIITRLNTKRGRQMALMLASSEPDGELFKAFANRVILKGRQDGLAMLQAQKARGLIDADADLSLVLDMIFGAIMLRLLLRHEILDVGVAKQALAVAYVGIARTASE